MKDNIFITRLEDNSRKTSYTREILKKLPEWFGNSEAIDDYTEKVQELPFWAAMNDADACVGIFSVKTHYHHTGEIFVCGVLPEYQHQGIGRALYQMALNHFIQAGCKYVVVKTLSDAVDFKPYAQTRKFYESIGFEPLITLTEMWDEDNPCLIMFQSVLPNDTADSGRTEKNQKQDCTQNTTVRKKT